MIKCGVDLVIVIGLLIDLNFVVCKLVIWLLKLCVYKDYVISKFDKVSWDDFGNFVCIVYSNVDSNVFNLLMLVSKLLLKVKIIVNNM